MPRRERRERERQRRTQNTCVSCHVILLQKSGFLFLRARGVVSRTEYHAHCQQTGSPRGGSPSNLVKERERERERERGEHQNGPIDKPVARASGERSKRAGQGGLLMYTLGTRWLVVLRNLSSFQAPPERLTPDPTWTLGVAPCAGLGGTSPKPAPRHASM